MLDIEQLAARNAKAATVLICEAQLVASSGAEQVLALVTAAATILERDVGAANAGRVLSDLLEPTYADWRVAAAARAH